MHEQLELMTMAAIFPSQPFGGNAVASILEAIDLARTPTAQQDVGCALAHVTCEYWIHVRPQVLTPHLGFRSLGRSPTVTLRASDHFECIDPSFSTRCGDFGYERVSVRMEEYRKPDCSSQARRRLCCGPEGALSGLFAMAVPGLKALGIVANNLRRSLDTHATSLPLTAAGAPPLELAPTPGLTLDLKHRRSPRGKVCSPKAASAAQGAPRKRPCRLISQSRCRWRRCRF